MTTLRFTYICPDLENQEDVEILREAISSVAGVAEFEIDFRTKQVIVETNDEDGARPILAALRHAGYPPED